MKSKKIIIAGGTGFIGEEMTKYFGKENQIIILSRNIQHTKTNRNNYSIISEADKGNIHYLHWDGKTLDDWITSFEGADIIINLAGKTVNCRYNEHNKQEIFDSRTNATKIIGEAIHNCTVPPKLWINASSATIYRHATDKPQDEYTGEYHDDFSVQVCKLWEKTFYEQRTPFTRKIALRMAITLGAGGVMIPYFNLLKFGLGGKQASGKQMYSWVHIEDTCRMIEWLYDHNEVEGTFNCCSHNPITNEQFMTTLRKVTNTKFGLPAYEWMLRLGAPLIGTEVELVLKSRWVIPTKILETGFQFRYSLLEDALKEIITKVPRKQYHLF
ncbi:MAG: TIGR01777 family protein [Sphingobacteriales bacterium]|nr:TIGR01777 family protein [Sphingobacteriales bacterium]MBI3719300.1 TIGR01777 family protein [Sphingobacteriales bacterium]